MLTKTPITGITHPTYSKRFAAWEKWRLTFEGGDPFIDKYLVRFSNREDQKEYIERKALAYCPAFAKSAIWEVRNAIYNRSSDITRGGGSKSYQDAVNGRA